jgi:hypothetical protein
LVRVTRLDRAFHRRDEGPYSEDCIIWKIAFVWPEGGQEAEASRFRSSRQCWFETYLVVHRIAKPLLTAKVPLRRLDAHMAQQKLDLLKFTAGFVAQTGACAPAMPNAA